MIVQLPTQTHNNLADGVAATNGDGDEIVAAPVQNSSNPSSSPAPKKRAETWVQEETRALISFRKEIDSLFNTSKSNKHLWENISLKMREKGFDRSATMCTDKWRNLLKEFKKAKTSNQDGNGNGSAKMGYYKEIEEILNERSKDGPGCGGGEGVSKVDSFMQFADKGIDDVSLTFGPMEDNGRSTLNLETSVDHDGHPLAITAAEAVAASGASPWGWRETPGEGEQGNINYGKVITVKLGDYIKKVGIDGTHDAIKEAIRSCFRLRSKRAFWLEDEYNVVRTIDREMPIGNYTLHVDEGLTIKVMHENVRVENRTFFSEDDYRDFLSRHGWTCLQECDSFGCIVCMDDLCPGAMYRGVD